MVFALTGLYLSVQPSQALNPAHEAAVEFALPLLEASDHPSLLAAESYTHDALQRVRVPASFLYPVNREWQVGLGLKTRWYDEPNNFRHLLAGAEYRWSRDLSFQVDGLLGVANYAGDAISLGGKYRLELHESFLVWTRARLGFLDALVFHPDYAVLSGILTPQWLVNGSFTLEVDVFAATQLPGVADFFSLDAAPSFTLRFGRDWAIRLGAVLGVAGSDPADPRFQMMQQISL